MKHIKLYESFGEEELKSPFFIEATEDDIDDKLVAAGIHGGSKMQPPYVGVSKDGRVWEMFMHKKDGKSGWMVHDTGKRIKPEMIKKYVTESMQESAWDEANKAAETMFGEFGVSTLKSDELDAVIDVKAADKIAKAKFGEFGFATCSEDQQREIIDANPKLVNKTK